jgi:Cu/Ag efflux pump CusA
VRSSLISIILIVLTLLLTFVYTEVLHAPGI